MTHSKLTEKLEFDIKFLLWRAEVHNLAPADIRRRYQEIEQHYLELSDHRSADLVRDILAVWHSEIERLSNHNQLSA